MVWHVLGDIDSLAQNRVGKRRPISVFFFIMFITGYSTKCAMSTMGKPICQVYPKSLQMLAKYIAPSKM